MHIFTYTVYYWYKFFLKTMASFGETFKKLTQGFSQRGGGSVLGVDISSSTIKVVQLGRKHGQAVLETYGELALGPYAGIEAGKATNLSSAKLGEAVADLVREAKATTINCGVAIPLSASLINIIEMPDVGERRLKEMVPLEVRKYIPVSINEVVLNWSVVPHVETTTVPEGASEVDAEGKKKQKVEILTVAVHKETVSRYNEVIQAAKLNPSFFEIEVFSTIRVALEESLVPTMVIGIGAGSTKVYIVDRKVLRESHIMSRGSQEITIAISKALGVSIPRAEELKRTYGVIKQGTDTDVAEISALVLDSLLTEAQRVMLNYQKKYARNISRVVLTGGGTLLPGLVDRAQSILQTDVTVADPFKKVQTPAFLSNVLQEVGPEFDVALGVALRRLEETL